MRLSKSPYRYNIVQSLQLRVSGTSLSSNLKVVDLI